MVVHSNGMCEAAAPVICGTHRNKKEVGLENQ